MPVKILLADKSITIQKVVEMLFSGREYEVLSASDGETALAEAERVVPDVVLVDVDLPRIDGYTFATRLKKIPVLAQTPVILMMSRDDVFDANKGKQAGILDNIAKPFESQELIGKVKKALAAAPPRLSEPAQRPVTAPRPPEQPRPAAPVIPPAAAFKTLSADKPKTAPPADIFDIISEAPSPADLAQTNVSDDETVYEVEPEVEEVDEPLAREQEKSLPIGDKAVEEMRAGLGLGSRQKEPQPEIATFESFGIDEEPAEKILPVSKPATPIAAKQAAATFPSASMIPPVQPQMPDEMLKAMVQEIASKTVTEALGKMPVTQPSSIPEHELRRMTDEKITKMAEDFFKSMPPPPMPKISDDTVRRGIEDAIGKIAHEVAKEVIEQVAWEVIPRLAEHLIKAEIERLKSME